MDVTVGYCVPSVTTQSSLDCEANSLCNSDSKIDPVFDRDERLCGEDLDVDSLCYSDSEIDSVFDTDEILCEEDSETASPCYSASEIDSVFDTDEVLCGEDLEVDSLCYSDSEIDSVFDTDEIHCGEDLETDSLCYSDSEIDSVFDIDEILRGENLEVDSLYFEPVSNTDNIYSEKTLRLSSLSTPPVISVEEAQAVDAIAAALAEPDASSENVGEVMHVPQEKVSEARVEEVEVDKETEVSVAVRRRRPQRQRVHVSSLGVSGRTWLCRKRVRVSAFPTISCVCVFMFWFMVAWLLGRLFLACLPFVPLRFVLAGAVVHVRVVLTGGTEYQDQEDHRDVREMAEVLGSPLRPFTRQRVKPPSTSSS